MEDALDIFYEEKMKVLSNPMTEQEEMEFIDLQKKNRSDEQWKKMRIYFNRPLADDTTKYRKGNMVSDENVIVTFA
jgi:hypothetical protein